MINPLDITTFPVNLTGGAGSTEIVAARAGQRWVVVLAVLGAGAVASDFVVLSAATPITGVIPLLGSTFLTVGDGAEAVWIARSVSEALNIDPGAGDIDGFVNVVFLK